MGLMLNGAPGAPSVRTVVRESWPAAARASIGQGQVGRRGRHGRQRKPSPIPLAVADPRLACAREVWHGRGMPPHVIRSLDDFLQVPEAQLPNCLAALHRAIEAQKKLRESAQVRGLATRFTEFEWRPKEPRKPVALQVTATTAVQDLGLKPTAVFHFREMNLYALEDFAEVTAMDLRRVPDVGDSTVAQIRELLAVVGLRFREPTDPYYARLQRAKLARGMTALERNKNISDAADIADLGLKSTTLTRCIEGAS